ncbi:MAG: CPXCG motif-containing cysteine-rich protein [Halioglobus sp.]|nr:CPXCG motif-containing cysteine-rich protein [Halioglobus sp.]
MTVNELVPRDISCPYCGEAIEVLLDCSIDQQHYIEDCQVCCRPIEFRVTVDYEGDVSVAVTAEND